MTIEVAPKSSSAASAKAGDAASTKKNASASAGSGSGANTFLSALACAEDGVSPVAADAVSLLAGADGLALAGAGQLADDPQQASGVQGIDPAAWLTQSAVVAASQAPTPSGPAQSRPGSVGGRADGGLQPPGVADSGLSKFHGLQGKSGKVALDAAADAAKQGAQDAPAAAPATSAVVAKEGVPERVHKVVQELTTALLKPSDVSTLSLGLGRDRVQELQSAPRAVVADLAGQSWSAPQGAGGAMGMDGVVAGAATASTDTQYAEQVSYWIGQEIQKAEMTLDGLGANPVEVSISMQGKEATVVFRSDEALTRDALSSASAELQEALGRQGVMLSGVSVGTSNAGDSQRQGSGGKPQGWRVKTVEAAAEAVSTGAKRLEGPGRSIDLFV